MSYENTALATIVKKHLRITTDTMDDEVAGLIATALDDMKMRGIDTDTLFPGTDQMVSDMSALAVRAVVYYCKANFGIAVDTRESDQYMTRYDGLTQSMSLCADYRIAPVIEETDETVL